VTTPNPSLQEINKILRFFHTQKSKYIFIVLEDERMLNDILDPIITVYEKEGKEVTHYTLKPTNYFVYQQIHQWAFHPDIKGLFVSGFNELIEKFGDTFLDNLNRSRDAFKRMAIPIAWIVDQNSLSRIIRGASDFYHLRELSDFHFLGSPPNSHPRQEINFFYNPYPGDRDIDEIDLEKRINTIPDTLKHQNETINGLVLPLLRYYLQQGNINKLKNLFQSFIIQIY